MPRTLGRRTQRTFFWIALVPVTLAAVGWWSAHNYDERLEAMRHTRDVLDAIDDVVLTTTDAEAAQRGFLITGRHSYLDGYHQALVSLDPALKNLRSLVAGNPVEARNAELLEADAHAKIDELRQTVDLAAAGKRPQAMHIVESDRGQQLMKAIRSAAANMRTLEQAELWRRIREQARLRRELATIFIAAVLVTGVLLAWAQHLIWKYGQQRAAAEAEVRRLNAGLEEKVAQQTASLTRTNEELRRSNSDLERFAWIATHDLQEPLRMVSTYVGLLAKRYEGRLDDNADTYIGFASEGAKRMRELINALLTYVRAGVERPRLSSVDCERLLADVLYHEHVKITRAGAAVTHDALPVITSDQELLSSVFRNLIDNAIKFRKPNEPARVHIGAREVDGAWQFSFRDEGIGFDQRYAERILVLFQKLHAPGEYPGTGLGLAVARRIVEGLGGHLTAESEPGRGATFFVTLPGAEAAEGTRQPAHT